MPTQIATPGDDAEKPQASGMNGYIMRAEKFNATDDFDFDGLFNMSTQLY